MVTCLRQLADAGESGHRVALFAEIWWVHLQREHPGDPAACGPCAAEVGAQARARMGSAE